MNGVNDAAMLFIAMLIMTLSIGFFRELGRYRKYGRKPQLKHKVRVVDEPREDQWKLPPSA